MLDLTKFAKEVHQNAVEHGWWEEERPLSEVAALIHSEWSEALEEYRSGSTMVWYQCHKAKLDCDKQIVRNTAFCSGCDCSERKPNGIAVELIDGCIRILDYFGKMGASPKLHLCNRRYESRFPTFIADLHIYTSSAVQSETENGDLLDDEWQEWLGFALGEVFEFVKLQKLNPEKLLLEKHEYNKQRPYKHGGKVC